MAAGFVGTARCGVSAEGGAGTATELIAWLVVATAISVAEPIGT